MTEAQEPSQVLGYAITSQGQEPAVMTVFRGHGPGDLAGDQPRSVGWMASEGEPPHLCSVICDTTPPSSLPNSSSSPPLLLPPYFLLLSSSPPLIILLFFYRYYTLRPPRLASAVQR